MKRIFALMLCMLICVSVLPVAAFAEGQYHVAISGGMVSSGTDSDGNAGEGEVITVTANVPEGKTFKRWTGSSGVVFSDSAANSTTFVMPPADVSIEALFEVPVIFVQDENTAYNVTVTGGTADKTSAVAGASVSIEASIPEGKVFKGWTSTPGVSFASSAESSTTFTMPESNVSVSAIYENVATRGMYGISITGATEDTPSSAAAGTTVTITAAVPSGKEFDKWTSETEGVIFQNDETTPTTFTMPNRPVEITAIFKNEVLYDVTVTNGSAEPASAAAGTTVTITASSSSGKVFDRWTSTSEGVNFADANATSTTFTMPANDVVIAATFKGEDTGSNDTEYNITVTGGTADSAKAKAGATVKITATVPDGEVFKRWTSNTQGLIFANATADQTTFTMPNKNVSISAEFGEEYTVTFDTVLPPGITIKNAPDPQEVPLNGTATKPADPSDSAQHHKFVGWYKGDGTLFSFDSKITSDITLYAKWKHPYDEGICYYCWKAQPSFSEVEQPGFTPEITRGIIGKPPSTAHYGSSHSFVVNTCFQYVEKSVDVYVDGKWIKLNDQYKLSEGSTIVTLRPWYIKSLTPGEHTIRIDTNLGTVRGSFRVSASPKTGDDSNIALWVTVGVISAAGVAGVAYYLLKKRKK